jgi:class 3 adenylate cyclase
MDRPSVRVQILMEPPGTYEQSRESGDSNVGRLSSLQQRARTPALVVAAVAAAALPLVGLVSLLLRKHLDPHIENYRAHFVIFGVVGALAFLLGYAAGEAANRRGDARVLLLSLAFMTTGGFLGLHAIGTQGVLFENDLAGFQVAIPVGLLVSAVFAAGSAFVDVRPGVAAVVMRRRRLLRVAVLMAMAAWFVWTIAKLPPLRNPNSEAAKGSLLAGLAIVGTVVYAVSAARYWTIFRHRRNILAIAVIACFLLLSEAMIGVAVTGERKWHASWWEWHGLIVTAYLIIGFAARREWREERFRHLYLPTTRERRQQITVLFGDLVGFTRFAERSTPTEVAAVLDAYWGIAAPLITRRFGGELEKFIGDAMLATFNSRGDQPDHALRAARAALALQEEVAELIERHSDWPRLRVGVNTGEAVVREIGGDGHVAYPLVGDAVNTGSRLESLAPAGGVLVGSETYEQLPEGAIVEPRTGLRVKGKDSAIDAYVLLALPC